MQNHNTTDRRTASRIGRCLTAALCLALAGCAVTPPPEPSGERIPINFPAFKTAEKNAAVPITNQNESGNRVVVHRVEEETVVPQELLNLRKTEEETGTRNLPREVMPAAPLKMEPTVPTKPARAPSPLQEKGGTPTAGDQTAALPSANRSFRMSAEADAAGPEEKFQPVKTSEPDAEEKAPVTAAPPLSGENTAVSEENVSLSEENAVRNEQPNPGRIRVRLGRGEALPSSLNSVRNEPAGSVPNGDAADPGSGSTDVTTKPANPATPTMPVIEATQTAALSGPLDTPDLSAVPALTTEVPTASGEASAGAEFQPVKTDDPSKPEVR